MQLELFGQAENKVTLEELFKAYYDCRKHKRKTINALAFEADFENRLLELYDEINNGTYLPGRSIAFIVTKPVKREVFAADFRDRVVHHLIINKIHDLLEAEFIEDSYSCRVGKGVQYGIQRVAEFIYHCSDYYTKDCYILKMDIKSFFMSIDKQLLFKRLQIFINEKYQGADKELLIDLVHKVVCHNPENNCYVKGKRSNWDGLPPSKSLFTVNKNKGLPIGNLTSQMFANFYLNSFDRFVKEVCGIEYYGRYVDDFVIVHPDKDYLLRLKERLKAFIKDDLMLTLHPNKVYLQHYSKGVKFIGAVVKPGRQYIGNRTKGNLYEHLREFNLAAERDKNYIKNNAEHFVSSVNSYLGFMIHYSTYKLRRKMLTENISPAWQKVISYDADYKKIELKKDYKSNIIEMKKIKKRVKRHERVRRRINKELLALGISSTAV